MGEALIILLPKPGKPKSKCGNWHPINLLNSNTKILCKVIARRLEGILPSVVGKDQNVFLQGKQGFHNVRRVLNILYSQQGAPDTPFNFGEGLQQSRWPYMSSPSFGLERSFVIGLSYYMNIHNDVVSKAF